MCVFQQVAGGLTSAAAGGSGTGTTVGNTNQLVMTGLTPELALKLKDAGALSAAAGTQATTILNVAEKLKVGR